MNRPAEKVNEIKEIYKVISALLDKLSDDNFDSTMGQVNNYLRLVKNLVKDLKNRYNKEVLVEFDAEIEPLVKQINIKFDNITDRIKAEQSEISIELNKFQNKKKLANYNR